MEKSIKSQKTRILQHLQSGHSITPLEALKKFDCFRLGARIWDLKREGYPIKSSLISDAVTGKQYAQYSLN